MKRYSGVVLVCVILATALTASAAEKASALQRIELLWPNGAVGAKGDEDGDRPTRIRAWQKNRCRVELAGSLRRLDARERAAGEKKARGQEEIRQPYLQLPDIHYD